MYLCLDILCLNIKISRKSVNFPQIWNNACDLQGLRKERKCLERFSARVFGTIIRQTSKDSGEWQWFSVKRNTPSFLFFIGIAKNGWQLVRNSWFVCKNQSDVECLTVLQKIRIIRDRLEILKDSLLFIPLMLFANFYSIYSEGIWQTRECLHKPIQERLYCFYIKAIDWKQKYLHPTSQH